MEFARFKAIASFLILLSLVSRSVPCGEIQQQEAPKICFESDLEIEFVESNSTSQAKNFTIQNTVRIVGDQLVEFTFSAHRNYVVRPTYIYPLPPKEENQSPCPDEKEKKEECTKSYLKLGPLSSCELDEQVSLQCGGSSSAKKIVIQGSVSIPSQTPCTYTVNRFSSHVCQLRVDFSTNMPQPTEIPPASVPGTMPYCGTSYLSIGEMRFCGINTNQHIYLPFGQKTISETISVLIGSNNNANWRVIVTQLECPPDINEEFKQITHTSPGQILDINKLMHKQHYDTDLIAPNGCLQYFPNTTGVFESFNYNGGAGPYLPGMKYAICFDRPATFSNIQFSAERFNMSRAHPSYIDVPMTDAECIDERGDTLVHHNDHFLIPYSTILQTGDSATRYCGDILEGQNLIANPPGPLEVLVNIGTLYYPLNFGPRPPRAFRVSYSIQ